MSIAHLLNFRYERPASIDPGHAPSSSHHHYGQRRKSQQLRARSKESFLQTNGFRFVLAPTAPPAHPAIYDADCLMDWDFVDQVLIPSHGDGGLLADCAICLDAPTAPRITKCGHHFCAACILRHLDGHRCRRCPLCFESVARGDLRPVEPTPALAPDDGGLLEFRLLARVKGTLTPAVVAGAEEEEGEGEEEVGAETEEEESKASPVRAKRAQQGRKQPHLLLSQPAMEGIRAVLPCVGAPSAAFCRLMASTEAHEEAALAREEGELRRARAEAVGLGEAEQWAPFIDEALAEVAARRKRFTARRGLPPAADASGRPLIPGAMPAAATAACGGGGSGSTTPAKKGRSASPPGSGRHHPHHHGGGGGGNGNRPRGYSGGENMAPPPSSSSSLDASASGESGGGGREGKAPAPSSPTAASAPAGPAPDPVSLFYQLRDGSYAFLHPLNMRCLMADAGGDTQRLPPRVGGRVLEVERVTLTPELRARYGFLKHLPLYSQVQLVELEMRPPLLSEAVYAQFRPEMKKRAQKRKQRERAEAKERRLAAMAAAAEGQGAVDWASLRGAGLTEAEIAEIQRRREEGPDLDGPLPWQAMLVAGETDPERRKERLEALLLVQQQQEDGVEESSGSGEEAGTGTSPPLVSSFAEITRRNGHFPSLLGGNEMFPALGGGGGSSVNGPAAPPLGMSPPSSAWAAAAAAGGGPRPAVPGSSSSSPPSTGAWGSSSSSSSKASVSNTPPAPSSTSSSSALPWPSAASAASAAASMRAGIGTTAGSSSSAAVAIGKKKGKGKGVPIFMVGSQRSYA